MSKPERNGRAQILLLDDHGVFRDSLAQALSVASPLEVVGCGTVSDALKLLREHRFDLAIIDFDLGQESALTFFRALEASGIVPPRMAVLTAGVSRATARTLLATNAVCGLLIKQIALSDLVVAISKLVTGESVVDPRYAEVAADQEEVPLTSREREVMRALVNGLSNKEVAVALFTSESTIKNTLQGLFRKFDVRTRSQLVRIALEMDPL